MLQGNKILLREKRPEDAMNDYSWRVDPELARLDAARPLRLAFQEFKAFYLDELRYPSPRTERFGVDSLEGRHIGNCMLYDIDLRLKQAELGILLGDKDYWNRKYGEDTIITLVRYAFEEMDLKRVYLQTLDWNIRAQKCFSNCGFVAYGIHTRDAQDFILMESLRDKPDSEHHS